MDATAITNLKKSYFLIMKVIAAAIAVKNAIKAIVTVPRRPANMLAVAEMRNYHILYWVGLAIKTVTSTWLVPFASGSTGNWSSSRLLFIS